jgi:hypothetical protein
MRLAALCLALVFVLAEEPIYAAEIDSVTGRDERLDNSMRRMNRRINDILRDGISRANERNDECDADDLYAQIRKATVSPFIGHSLAEKLNEAEDLDRRRIPFRESIYRDLGAFDAISVHVKDLSAVIRLDDHLVGVDKFGHYLVQGWKYFDIAYRDGDGVEAAMDWGEGAERTYYGFYTTGVYSYADLAVNFEGMRLWRRLLGRGEDPLETGWFGGRPYVKCSKRFVFFGKPRWRLRRRIRLGDYVTGAWDEGTNCSRYRNAEIAGLIDGRVREREIRDARDYACPIEANACVRARERYKAYASRLLHPSCFEAEPEPRPWWKFW